MLLKDNIATHDRMHTTVGAYAMKDWRLARDAFLVRQLRNAGAVILGKANLSEWANYMDPAMPSGFSDLGGQTRNPYGPYEVWGSSSGSTVAAAASLAAATVGTATMGSLIMPVAIKTSRGLIGRDNILPLIDWMDVPGPMARSVTDAAVLLSSMTGTDENDGATRDAASLAGTDFTRFLDLTAEQYRKARDIVHTDFARLLHSVFAKYGIDVLVTNLQTYAPAGLPAITVPAGYDENGQPFGVTMIADFLGEPKLITAGYAYEQTTKARREPDLATTIRAIERCMAEK